jgi:hypothetical protein
VRSRPLTSIVRFDRHRNQRLVILRLGWPQAIVKLNERYGTTSDC